MVCSLCGRSFLEIPVLGTAVRSPPCQKLVQPSTQRVKHSCKVRQPSSQRSSHITAVISPGICFDAACQQAADRAFLVAIALPLLGLIFAIVWKLRTPEAKPDEGEVFRDPESGAFFQGPEPGVLPERDSKGELAFRPISYTPWPVDAAEDGQRIRVDVGPISRRSPRTFVFDRLLQQPSQILSVTLPRPVGIVFEEDKRKGQATICGFLPGSNADKQAKVAKLNQQQSPQVGDVLRACTCTTFVFPTRSLLGAQPPVRTIVMYGADGQTWAKVATALKKGDRSDGAVTLVLERPLDA
ncbi:hypothetical protein WJX74_007752 [Apatococcus lobatus]|uniref:Uncharacterized protein n=1 Tax=Apatococcus lobatus TaxID=904363 RepID=A0AAW1RKY5_9CHLO